MSLAGMKIHNPAEKMLYLRICKLAFIGAAMLYVSGCMFLKPDYLKVISAETLNQTMQQSQVFLVDVHIPEQQHIKGTDAFIPFNKIAQNIDQLPADKSAPVYLYCESGPMGNAAARALHQRDTAIL